MPNSLAQNACTAIQIPDPEDRSGTLLPGIRHFGPNTAQGRAVIAILALNAALTQRNREFEAELTCQTERPDNPHGIHPDCTQLLVRRPALRLVPNDAIRAPSGTATPINAGIKGMTPRQIQMLHHVLDGQPSKNIATDLHISRRTVQNHRAAIPPTRRTTAMRGCVADIEGLTERNTAFRHVLTPGATCNWW